MRTGFILGLVVMGLLCLGPTVSADGPVKVTQVDPSRFPEVALYITVSDERGQPRGGLTRDDFHLFEDGKQVPIKDFAGIGEARPVDIVFVFDTTGSMSAEIAGVKNTCVAFADKLRRANRDFRLGLVTFGDEIRQVYGGGDTLTGDADEFKGWIGRQNANGGGDDAEISLDALERATRMHYRPGTQKVLILITDAPPHVKGDGAPFSQVEPEKLTASLRDGGYTVYAVAYDDPRFRRVAEETHGEFYDLHRESDFTGIIDKIGGQIASQYRMTYLSARPSYDGTRRAIEVEVVGKKAEGTYLEKHLINVRSTPLIAGVLLAPLLLALVLPVLIRQREARARQQPAVAQERRAAAAHEVAARPEVSQVAPATASGVAQPQPAVAPVKGEISCPNCGTGLRLGAKFCGHCGKTIAVQVSIPTSSPTYCPSCGGPLRPGARFCGVCGYNMG